MNNQPALSKSLKVYQIVFLGLAWMTPMIFFTVYGVAYNAAGGQMVLAYLIAFLAIFFTAYSYSRMVKASDSGICLYVYEKSYTSSPWLFSRLGTSFRLYFLPYYRYFNIWYFYAYGIPFYSCIRMGHCHEHYLSFSQYCWY